MKREGEEREVEGGGREEGEREGEVREVVGGGRERRESLYASTKRQYVCQANCVYPMKIHARIQYITVRTFSIQYTEFNY